MAAILLLQGKTDEGLAEAREAVRLDPKATWGYERVVWALNLKGQYDEAIKETRAAMQIDPKLPWGHEHLAWSLNSEGSVRPGHCRGAVGHPAKPQ